MSFYEEWIENKNTEAEKRFIEYFLKLVPESTEVFHKGATQNLVLQFKIKLYYGDIFIKEFEYIGLCLQYLIDIGVSKCKNSEVLRSQVNKCIKNNTIYKRYRFVVNKGGE